MPFDALGLLREIYLMVIKDENLAERAVKPFVIGRKNWLFSTSPKGADASAAAYSIINTAQANGIDVKEYLTNIFRTGERRLPLKSE